MTTQDYSLSELEEMIFRLKEEIKTEKKEHELLKFDLKEMQGLNKTLSDEIDRLFENISYLTEENKKLGKQKYV